MLIKKTKAYWLKSNVSTQELLDLGFETYNDNSYWRDNIVIYYDTKIIKYKDYPWWSAKKRHVKPCIKDLIQKDLVIIEKYVYIVNVFGDWRRKDGIKVDMMVDKCNKIQENIWRKRNGTI